MNPPEPDRAEPQARQYTIEDVVCYHEAAHAVVWWHYGIEIRCISVRPDDCGHRGQSAAVEYTPVGMVELEIAMRCAAAGDIAERRLNPARRLPTEPELGFDIYARRLSRERDLAAEDTGAFVGFGLARDDAIRTAGIDAPTGPAGWLPVWREAEHLIRVELWPAVCAVAGELCRSERDLCNADVAALAEAAMGGRSG